MRPLSIYLHDEKASSTVENILLVIAVIAAAGIVAYKVMNYLTSSSENSSCANSNEVFCTE